MAGATLLGEFLVHADRKLLSVHDAAVDAPLDPTLALRPGMVLADEYELCVRTAQDSARIRVLLENDSDGDTAPLPEGEQIAGRAVVAFPDGNLVVSEGTYGAQAPVPLPGGAGRYQITVSTSQSDRQDTSRQTDQIIAEEDDLAAMRTRLRQLDGREWYRLRLRRLDPQAPQP